jgi:hypothetical protein
LSYTISLDATKLVYEICYVHISTTTFNSTFSGGIRTIAIRKLKSRSAACAHEDGPGSYLVKVLGDWPSAQWRLLTSLWLIATIGNPRVFRPRNVSSMQIINQGRKRDDA